MNTFLILGLAGLNVIAIVIIVRLIVLLDRAKAEIEERGVYVDPYD